MDAGLGALGRRTVRTERADEPRPLGRRGEFAGRAFTPVDLRARLHPQGRLFLGDIDQRSIAAAVHGASTRYAAITTVTKRLTVDHVRLVLGETGLNRCTATRAGRDPAGAARYARQQIEILRGQSNPP